MVEYHARFLALERFAPGTFQPERHRATKYVIGLHLRLWSAMSMFLYATFEEAIARALEGDTAHLIHNLKRSKGQYTQSQTRQAQGQWLRSAGAL